MMNLYICYLVLFLFTLFSGYYSTNIAEDINDTVDVATYTNQSCFLEIDIPSQTISNTYKHIQQHSACLNDIDTGKVRGCKYTLLPFKYIKCRFMTEMQIEHAFGNHSVLHLTAPTDYYVFGFCKIVI